MPDATPLLPDAPGGIDAPGSPGDATASFDASLAADMATIARITTVPTILRVVSEITGLRLALVARVTGGSWTACAVLDQMEFGLAVGGRLDVATTLCSEVRDSREPIVIEHASVDPTFCQHPTPKMYGFESYIAVPITRPNGVYFGNLCALDSRPLPLRDGRTLAVVKLFAELIALHLVSEEESVREREALSHERETAQLREQFIAVLGHDLRSPLAAVTTGAEFLLSLPQDDTQRIVLERIRSSAGRMSRLIADIMDFARGRLGGGISLERELLDVQKLVTSLVEEVAAAHPRRTFRVTAEGTGVASLDRSRAGQLFANLLSNAVEHGDADAPIDVRISVGESVVTYSVSNRAPGSVIATTTGLFKPFFRSGERRARPGLGLGLYIAAEIARGHGGRIAVHATPDGLVTFSVHLPRDAGESGPRP